VAIAVIGAGVAGLTASYLLSRQHHVDLFEQEPRLGGHAHTHTVARLGGSWPVDTGFLVFNERTYPHFIRLLDQLGVASQPSDMSFGVRCRRCGLEYASRSLSTLVAQRRRLFDAAHLRMLFDIPRYFAAARTFLASGRGFDVSLGQFLDEARVSSTVRRHFVLPMGGAIWSASFADMLDAPARTILHFYENHGLLAQSGAPPWRTITGGSRRYVEAIRARVSGTVFAGRPVERVVRHATGVDVHSSGGPVQRYDAVVVATHADTALGLLGDADEAEREALSPFRYSSNRTVLHTDAGVLPATRRAWAAWNCDIHDCHDSTAPVSMTYHLNRLQGVGGAEQFCVTLNGREPVQGDVLAEMHYTHPILDRAAVAAQSRVDALNGHRRTYYCGAHLRYGFHEDGVVSALRVAAQFGEQL
jgi:predicted NAD/FAD-binding protein